MLKTHKIEPARYRDAMANFAGAVHLVTTDGAGGGATYTTADAM